MRIANFRCPIADLALKKENLKFKLANRKSKYYLLPNNNPKSTKTQLCGHKLHPVYLYQIVYLLVKVNLWLMVLVFVGVDEKKRGVRVSLFKYSVALVCHRNLFHNIPADHRFFESRASRRNQVPLCWLLPPPARQSGKPAVLRLE